MGRANQLISTVFVGNFMLARTPSNMPSIIYNIYFADSVQQELKMFYNNLNSEEKAQLKKFAKMSAANFSFTDIEFFDTLKVMITTFETFSEKKFA